jgi:hypothetical protein
MLAISRATVGVALGAAVAATLIGCGAAQRPASSNSAAVTEVAPQPAAPGPAPECVNDKDQPVECLSDGDCCSGFVCGKDPERNPRVSYCIYGG